MSPNELARAIAAAGRSDGDRLVREMSTEVGGELVGAMISELAVVLHRLEHDPVEIILELVAQ